ncbi:MAG: phosphoribosylglycinamide synthetase C domain-containing protein, partial [Acidimicrobiales bacterium]
SAREVDYRGVLYAGLMLTTEGPKVLEFNVRFGDPETQVVAPRWRGDVAAVLAAAATGRLDEVEAPAFSTDAAVCVVLAAEGYPLSPRLGDRIRGIDAAGALEGVQLYAAGVAEAGGELVTSGGRVLGVTGMGSSIDQARSRAYREVDAIPWTGMVHRSDIALEAAASEAQRSTIDQEVRS